MPQQNDDIRVASGFRLDFAPHLGFPTPATPLFGALAGSIEVEAQVALIASLGFQRVQDPFAAARSEADQALVGRATRAAGLGLGCFVFAPMAEAMGTGWLARDEAGFAELDALVEKAMAIGERIGSRHIAVLTGRDPHRAPAEQRDALAANLSRLAGRVAERGMMFCLEAVSAQRLPQMLLHQIDDAAVVVRAVGDPAVRLIFDTAHVQAMSGDILGNLDRTWELIELIQLADHPGRVEPGAGELNFVTIIDEIERREFNGPVELEHGWSTSGPEVQENYVRWLSRWSRNNEEKR